MFDSLLTLDESTLFFWTLSNKSLSKKRKHEPEAINTWVENLPCNVAPASCAPSNTTAPSRHSVPSLTRGTSLSRSRSSAPSNQTNSARIISCAARSSAKVNDEPAAKAIAVVSDGSLSDNDETHGEERLATICSPPKGKKWVTSDMSLVWVMCLVVIIVTDLLSRNL